VIYIVKLSASNSLQQKFIDSYVWFEDGVEIAEGKDVEIDDFKDGEHEITLVTTDSNGGTKEDTLIVTVTSNNKEMKQTGQEAIYSNYDDGYYQKGIAINYQKFTDSILDKVTGLSWKYDNEDDIEKKSWQDAIDYCRDLSGTWRLPTRDELSGLVRYDEYKPAIDDKFVNTASSSYWSFSTSRVSYRSAWIVNFEYGTETTSSKTTENFVRCVNTKLSSLAHAGEDQIVFRGDKVSLSASDSSNKERIESYLWQKDGSYIGNVENIYVTIEDGEHSISLKIIDEDGNEDTDKSLVTIIADVSKNLKQTGQDINYTDFDDGYYEKGRALSYQDNGNNIIDGVLDLEWRDDSDTDSIKKSWEDAREYCRSLGESWRLPTRAELSSLVHYANYKPAIDDSFDNTASSSYWSLSTSKTSYRKAWVVNFEYGTETISSKSTENFVRCVR